MAYAEKLRSGKVRGVYRDSSGRRRTAAFQNKTQALTWAREQERMVRLGGYRDPAVGRQPLGLFAADWWAARVAEPTTLATDRGRLDRHVLPEFGSWPLKSITTTAVQSWVKRLTRGGLAPATARSCFNLLAGILESARKDGLVRDNPCRGVDLPPVPAHGETYLTRGQVDAVASRMEPFDAAVVYTLAYTGLRWGELAGLHAGRLDLLGRRVTVAETMTEIAGDRRVKAYPKSRVRRTVPLPSMLVDVLAAHLGVAPARLTGSCGVDHLDGKPCRGGQLVFRPTSGALSRHSWGRGRFHPARVAAGVEHARVHDLRHTYASWLVQDGVNLYEVSRVLGHASIVTTQRYAHLVPDDFSTVLGSLNRGAPVGQSLRQ